MADPTIQINGIQIPVKIRRNRSLRIRYSISHTCINLNIPAFYTHSAEKRELGKLNSWVRARISQKPEILRRFQTSSYQEGQRLTIRDVDFHLYFKHRKVKHLNGKMSGTDMHITVPESWPQMEISKKMPHMISRMVSRYFLPSIQSRVHEINALHFKSSIHSVRLKYNRSNWGSCSMAGNINLSSRLLLAPDDVLDYVIIHELAHTRIMNHSAAFWNLVGSVMNDYRQKEAWLRQNGPKLHF